MKKLSRGICFLILPLLAGMLLAGCASGEQKKVFEQAEKSLKEGMYEQALADFESCITAGCLTGQSLRGAGIAQLRLGQTEQAAQSFERALSTEELSKKEAEDVCSYLAAARIQLGDYAGAMEVLTELSEKYGMNAESYYLTGIAALKLDSYEEASASFDQAYNRDPSLERALQIYGVYVEDGMEADGIRFLEASLARNPKSAKDYIERGRIYYYMEDYEEAAAELTQAVNEGSSEAALWLGMVYLEQGNTVNARNMFNSCLESEPGNGQALCGLVLCDMREENYDAALQSVNAALAAVTPDQMQSLLFNEAVIYERKLDFATAKQKFSAYLEMYPGDAQAERELRFCESRV